MKLMIASDIHGSAYWCARLTECYEKIMPERLLLLGDILYHGPRNDLPRDYAPKRVAELLNGISGGIICVRGNCEAEVDSLMLDFPITSENCMLFAEGRLIFATHGHVYNRDNVPVLHGGDILLHEHTHVPACEALPGGATLLNPGSVSIPKNGTPHSFMVADGGSFTWHDLEKPFGESTYRRWDIR